MKGDSKAALNGPSEVDGPFGLRLRGEVGGVERTFPIPAGESLVGGTQKAAIHLPVRGVSRRHARLEVAAEGLRVTDLESKNGTFVDERPVDGRLVRPGQILRFGPVALQLEKVPVADTRLGLEIDASGQWGGSEDRTDRGRLPEGDTSFLSQASGAPRMVPSAASGGDLDFPPGILPGSSPAMEILYRQMSSLVAGDLPVLILGETGVGKEHLAKTLHRSSERGKGPFVAVNCAALPAELLEAELFGIGRGVATGVSPRPGRFLEAQGGTILLDEIGELAPTLQAKLLRVLQEREIHPLGLGPTAVDVRVVSATNAAVQDLIAGGTFRRDLFYRLAGDLLEVPPLRQRREDIPRLVGHFLRHAAEAREKRVRGVTVKALQRLETYSWPGNVRELEHEVRRLVSRALEGQVIDSEMLGTAIRVGSDPEDSSADPNDLNLGRRTEQLERELIRRALRRTGGNKSHAARLLGISRNGLANRLVRYGLDPSRD